MFKKLQHSCSYKVVGYDMCSKAMFNLMIVQYICIVLYLSAVVLQ